MKALVKESAAPGMKVKEVPTPTVGANDVLIRVRHAGVCGTDLHIWEWDAWASARLKPPVVIGHEFAGEVAELGVEAKATGLVAVGDKVTAEGHIICGHCRPCRTGQGHVWMILMTRTVLSRAVGTVSGTGNGEELHGALRR